MNGLIKAIKIIGTQKKLALKLGVTSMAVSQWKKRRVPDWAVLRIEKATKSGVTRHELRPDLYPKETTQQAGQPS